MKIDSSYWQGLSDSQRRQVVALVATLGGAVTVCALYHHATQRRPRDWILTEGLEPETSSEAGIHVGSSANLLARTGNLRWEDWYPVVPYDPVTQGRYAGSGIITFGNQRFEVMNVGEGRMVVRRIAGVLAEFVHNDGSVPTSNTNDIAPDNSWDSDLWINGQFEAPDPAELPHTRWQHAYPHLLAMYKKSRETNGDSHAAAAATARTLAAPNATYSLTTNFMPNERAQSSQCLIS